ncbi:MAG: FAD-binding oxidoreductase [Thermodesulfobacteriota bacterium]|nr:FAD-binding oxidoreductase [Thermodesulfobacteriota bacterium]
MNLKEELTKIISTDKFSDRANDLEAFSRDNSSIKGCRPACIVRPENAEEIQKIIKLARESATPVVPSSSQVHFYGGTIPKLGGIAVDLSGMNKILDIDERNRKLRIEPGVTWKQVENELESKDYRVVIPLLPHPSSSVVTSVIEREIPVIPNYEYGELIGGAEVVWPNGDIFRTGSASAPNYPESASKGANFEGPGINFIHLIKGAQGTMGIVTWANVKMEYLPRINKTFFIPFHDLEKAIRPLYRIQRLRIGKECFLINNLNLALILSEGKREKFEKIRSVLPDWTLLLILSGPRRRPEEKIEYEERALMKLKQEEFQDLSISTSLSSVPGAGEKLQKLLRKPWPIEEPYWKHVYKTGCEDLFFITKPSRAPEFLDIVEEVAVTTGFPLSDIGRYLQPIEYGRACHMEFNFYYQPDNAKEVERVRFLRIETAKILMEEGAFFSRPYGDLARMVYERASSYTRALRTVKSMFDPDNIMNPGNLCF